MKTFHEWMEAHVGGTVTGDPRDRDWYLDKAATHARSEDERARRNERADRFVKAAEWFADRFREPNFAADVHMARQQIKVIRDELDGITYLAEKEIEYIVDAFHTPKHAQKGLEHPRFFAQHRR
jgi:hypothetical protein